VGERLHPGDLAQGPSPGLVRRTGARPARRYRGAGWLPHCEAIHFLADTVRFQSSSRTSLNKAQCPQKVKLQAHGNAIHTWWRVPSKQNHRAGSTPSPYNGKRADPRYKTLKGPKSPPPDHWKRGWGKTHRSTLLSNHTAPATSRVFLQCLIDG
jgi:hypothetical protein